MHSRTPIPLRPHSVAASPCPSRSARSRFALRQAGLARGQTKKLIGHPREHSFSQPMLRSAQKEELLAHNRRCQRMSSRECTMQSLFRDLLAEEFSHRFEDIVLSKRARAQIARPVL